MRAIEIKLVAINELIPYEQNPRINDDAVEYVANSIKEFGWKQPLVVDKNNVIVVGHTRLKAARQLGFDAVPCVYADDLTDDQIRAYRIADNATGAIALWDDELLELELEDIELDMGKLGLEFEPTMSDDEIMGFFEDKDESAVTDKKVCPNCGVEL